MESHPKHILVVDDEPAARNAMKKLLGESFTVDVAADGANALAVAAAHWPDAVVTDLTMPVMNGIELATKLHEIDSDLPIIFTTAVNELTGAVKAMRAGASDYFTKPIDFDALVDVVERTVTAHDKTKALKADLREANTELTMTLRKTLASMDDMREVAEFRERLIGIIGHDLRNPLNAVLMAASLLCSGNRLTPADAELAGRIQNSGRRMKNIIVQLVDFTHARLGGFPLKRSKMNLGTTCEQIAAELRMGAGARIDVNVAAIEGCWDADRLGQALSNIAGNAVEHAAPGTSVSIDASATDETCTIRVTNRGSTIPPDLLSVIFEPFRRGETTDRPGHLGLGLFIAREVVRAHGGTLDVESSDGTTTFSMHLPRKS